MIKITGKLPTPIQDSLNRLGIKIEDVRTSNDIDITLTASNNVQSSIYAINVGNGKWVIDELIDAANLFPEIEEGDAVSIDMFTKLFSNCITSSLILSFNPLGKIKYGVKDVVKDVKDKVNNIKGKIQKGIDWVTDALPPEVAQDYIRKQKGFSKARVGRVEKMYGEDGGNYKVLAGNPEDKTYSVWQIYRNGNDFRTLAVDKGLTPDNAIAKFDELLGKKYDGSEQDVYEEGQFADNLKPDKKSQNDTSGETDESEDNVFDEAKDDNTNNTSSETSQEEYEDEDNVADIGDDNDPYNVLNIPKDADLDTIKKAYRQLSKKYHPDKDTGDINRFNDIQKAYKALTSGLDMSEDNNIYESVDCEEEDNVVEEPEKKNVAVSDILSELEYNNVTDISYITSAYQLIEEGANMKAMALAGLLALGSIFPASMSAMEKVKDSDMNAQQKIDLICKGIKKGSGGKINLFDNQGKLTQEGQKLKEALGERDGYTPDPNDWEGMNELTKELNKQGIKINWDQQLGNVDEDKGTVDHTQMKKKSAKPNWNEVKGYVKSSIDDSDSDLLEEDNIIDSSESEPKKKSKYHGCNVTGCVEGDGTVALASGFIKSCLILSTIEQFQQKIREYQLGEEPKKFLTDILTKLYQLPKNDRLAITEKSGDNMLCLNFSKSNLTTENYNTEFKIFEDKVVAQDINMGNGQKIEGTNAAQMCINTLNDMIP